MHCWISDRIGLPTGRGRWSCLHFQYVRKPGYSDSDVWSPFAIHKEPAPCPFLPLLFNDWLYHANQWISWPPPYAGFVFGFRNNNCACPGGVWPAAGLIHHSDRDVQYASHLIRVNVVSCLGKEIFDAVNYTSINRFDLHVIATIAFVTGIAWIKLQQQLISWPKR